MDKDLFIIGDTHGKFAEVKSLIKKINQDKTRVIFAGDLIDRGSEGRKIIDFIRKNNFECVLGNHEIMLIDLKYLINSLIDLKNNPGSFEESYFEKENILFALASTTWFRCGGKNFFAEYGEDYEALLEDIEFLETLPVIIKTNVFDSKKRMCLVSHSCILPLLNDDGTKVKHLEKEPNEVVWNRFKPEDITYNATKYFNIFGHTPVDVFSPSDKDIPEPYVNNELGYANVDTGACYDRDKRGFLSGVFFPSLKILSVKSSFKNK